MHKILGPGYVCPVPQSIQILTEDELVVLAAPTSRCLDAVGQIEIVAEVYREEDLFRARERSAALSPDGDVLVVNDGETASIHNLP